MNKMPKIKMPEFLKVKPVIKKIIKRVNWNSRHYWCEAEIRGVTFLVRKPAESIKNLLNKKYATR